MTANKLATMSRGSGAAVSLGNEIARGGEGRILDVQDHPDLVAKIYHRQIDHEKAAKLSVMVGLKTERLLSLSAWPVDTLHDLVGGPVSGFLMPRITDHKDIHILYGVKSRSSEYPDANWPFLIQAAANVARAFNVIHEHGHVIGDVNHGSIVVSKRATVRLVDCDSFQITTAENQFLCEVGISTHLPPELQGKDLHGIVRTVDHDAFGLAIIIFQLLFMGRHPFSGTPLGNDDIPLEKAIKEHRFAYSKDSAYRQMRQPPASLGLDAVFPQIALMFEQAFLMDVNRPPAERWITALTEMAGDLQQCSTDTGHQYINGLQACPWCEIESHSGIVLFQGGSVGLPGGRFDIAKTWKEILSVPAPPSEALLRKSSILMTSRMTRGATIVENQRYYGLKAAGLVFFSVFGLATLGIKPGLYFPICTLLSFLASQSIGNKTFKARMELIKLQSAAENELTEASKIKKENIHSYSFSKALVELTTKKDHYENLSEPRKQKPQDLQRALLDHQLHEFLKAKRIEDADLSGIRSRDILALASCGIENAADVSRLSTENVPGLKPSQKQTLDKWRSVLRFRFRDEPKWVFNPNNWDSVETEVAAAKIKLQRELRSGPAYLRSISEQMRSLIDPDHPGIKGCIIASSQIQEYLKECSPKFWLWLVWLSYLLSLALCFLSSAP